MSWKVCGGVYDLNKFVVNLNFTVTIVSLVIYFNGEDGSGLRVVVLSLEVTRGGVG